MNWDKAIKWAEDANKDKIEIEEPMWSWDCGLKLDYDGPLVRVSSRFYQVQENIFDGSVSFYIGDDEIYNREFNSKHIDILKEKVEQYVKDVTESIKANLRSIIIEV